jgi:hypothetical protein
MPRRSAHSDATCHNDLADRLDELGLPSRLEPSQERLDVEKTVRIHRPRHAKRANMLARPNVRWTRAVAVQFSRQLQSRAIVPYRPAMSAETCRPKRSRFVIIVLSTYSTAAFGFATGLPSARVDDEGFVRSVACRDWIARCCDGSRAGGDCSRRSSAGSSAGGI